MKRRNFILGGVAAAVVPQAARAEVRCTQYDYNGVQMCEAGIPSLQVYSALQECPQWCWAACVQMVFARYGRLVRQRAIVEREYPDLACAAAVGPQIVRAVNSGPWYDTAGRRFAAEAYPLADFDFGVGNINAAAAAANELSNGHPLINGAVGHATVMTAMSFYRDFRGRGQVQSITVRDPWPGAVSRRTLRADEVYGTRLLLAVRL
jgi:hypothetical protein